MNDLSISIVIPTFNEEKIIYQTLQQFSNSDSEIIVIDGNSQDKTLEMVKSISEQLTNIKLIKLSNVGKASQMNRGAQIASGKILLFLHADTLLPKNYQQTIREILAEPDTIVGAFNLKISGQGIGLRFVEIMVRLRSLFFSLPYGDQGFFMTKDNFQNLGGFTPLPIMEDFELIRKAQKKGKIVISPLSVNTSDRRWHKLGVWKTTIINQLIIIGYYLRIPPVKLKKFYVNAAK